MSIKPIGPHDLLQNFPDEVILAFNNLLAKRMNSYSITILQKDAVKEIIKCFKDNGKTITSDQIFKKHWLDVEPNYRAQGWKVTFDKPGYCESYEASWTFSKK
jgi:hypothetical protein